MEYNREDYGRQFGNTKTSDYLEMNPTAKVPTLIDGNLAIWESNTILRYLAARYAEHLTGTTPEERTEVERWMDFLLAAVNPGYLTGFKGAKLKSAERPAGFDTQVADLYAQMQIVSTHLEDREFLALGRLTIADIALGPIMGRCLNFPYDRPRMPGIENWFNGISARDAFKVATL